MHRIVAFSFLAMLTATGSFAAWRDDADARIERLRKGDFTITVRDARGAPLQGVAVEARLVHHDFLFGTAIAWKSFRDQTDFGRAYRQFIVDHFSALVCENEMKWYGTEERRGVETYEPADGLLAFAAQHDLKMRGHCLFWAKPERNEDWVKGLDDAELKAAVIRHLNSIVPRYAGRLVCWDANNEMLDGSLFRDRLGPDAGAWIFREASRLDPATPLFVNEYAILGEANRITRYLELIEDLRKRGAPVGGIGIQSHDSDRLTDDPGATAIHDDRAEGFLKTRLTPAAFLQSLDRLHDATGLPVHLTEISARTPDAEHRGRSLEMLFRLGFSHPAVGAIMLWGFDARSHWMGADAALMNADGTLNVAGERISRLLREEWTSRAAITTAARGAANFRGFFGTYALKATLSDGRIVTREVVLTKQSPTVDVLLAP